MIKLIWAQAELAKEINTQLFKVKLKQTSEIYMKQKIPGRRFHFSDIISFIIKCNAVLPFLLALGIRSKSSRYILLIVYRTCHGITSLPI